MLQGDPQLAGTAIAVMAYCKNRGESGYLLMGPGVVRTTANDPRTTNQQEKCTERFPYCDSLPASLLRRNPAIAGDVCHWALPNAQSRLWTSPFQEAGARLNSQQLMK